MHTGESSNVLDISIKDSSRFSIFPLINIFSWNHKKRPLEMPLKIVDRYFYEELSRVVGHEASSQWLLSQNSFRSRHRSSYSSTGCSNTPCRTPERSSPPSPQLSTPAGFSDVAVPGLGNVKVSSSVSHDVNAKFSSSPIYPLSSSEAFVAASKLRSISDLSQSDTSRIGLIFTDAAHSILD